MHTLRVGIFMGGNSVEREVSFNSGRTVYDHLDIRLYTPAPIFQASNDKLYILAWKFMHRGTIADFEHRLAHEAQEISYADLANLVDFVFIAAHGAYVEDGRLQGLLELMHIPYTGSGVYASAISMHKHIQKQLLHAAGISVPHGVYIPADAIHDYDEPATAQLLAEHALTLPLIVKPIHGGSSVGVQRVTHCEQLHTAIMHAATINDTPQGVLIEDQVRGMEFSCSLLYDHHNDAWIALSLTEVVAQPDIGYFCYNQKYMPGVAVKHTPARCDQTAIKNIQAICIKAVTTLQLATMARVDGIYTHEGNVVIIDINPICGMDQASFLFHEAAHYGMHHTQVINMIISTQLHAYTMHTAITQRESMNREKKRLRIAVIFGGDSHEREISLVSGRNVIYKLSPDRYDVTLLFATTDMQLYAIDQQLLTKNRTAEIAAALSPENRWHWSDLQQRVDFVFNALHGGAGENGTVQGALEMMHIPYNGSSVATSTLCMQKHATTRFLHTQGFAVPASYLLHAHAYTCDAQAALHAIQTELSFPLVVKPNDDGCSVMVQKAHDLATLQAAIDLIFDSGKTTVLLEEYITGMELTVGCIGNTHAMALPPSMVARAHDILTIEEKFLPGAGENQTPAPLSVEQRTYIQATIAAVYKAVECSGYARIDCFYQTAEESPTGNERVVIIEINTLPGLTPATCLFHQAAEIGMRPHELIETIIELGQERHARNTQQHMPIHKGGNNMYINHETML